MELSVNGQVLSIAQLGPDFIMLDAPFDQPPAAGEIALWIDGRERRWHVFLVDGIAVGQRKTRTVLAPSAPIPEANGSTVRLWAEQVSVSRRKFMVPPGRGSAAAAPASGPGRFPP